MVIAIVILVFLVLGTGFACLNLFAYWKKANKERDEAQKSQKEWEEFGLAAKEENEVLAKYRPIADIERHIANLEAEAAARISLVNKETEQKEAVLREVETKAAEELQTRLYQMEKDAGERLATILSQINTKESDLKQAQELLIATRNTVEGYGNEYLVPKEALFDQLAQEYGYEKAGIKLKEARDITRKMIRDGSASTSQIIDPQQNEAAKDFIVDAFNGRIEGILAKAKKLTENYGVLRQQIIDAFNLVNESGRYVGTAITDNFLRTRLEELKWALNVQELIEEEKEEQRILKERLRDEALARKEAEKAKKELERQAEEQKQKEKEAEIEREKQREIEDQARRKAEQLAKELAEKEKAKISEEEKAKYLETIRFWQAKSNEAELKAKEAEESKTEAEKRAAELEEKYRREPLDPRGKIYIISNIGSFGDHVFKIGLTRREIEERVKELGDASVPFEFDVHAIIKTDNAPELESKLHQKLAIYRVNKSNWRKEFFKITIEELKRLIEDEGHETSWTMKAKALQYQETLEIEKKIKDDNEFREAWLNRLAKLETSLDKNK